MRNLVLAFLLLWPLAAQAQVGLPFPGPGRASGGSVGPPTFTFRTVGNPSISAPTTTYTGPTSAGSDTFLLVSFFVGDPNNNVAVSGTPVFTTSAGTTNGTVVDLGRSATGNGLHFFMVTATVASGFTSSSLAISFTNGGGGGQGAWYTAQASQMNSTTPTIASVATTTSAASLTSSTFNALSGASVISLAMVYSGSASSPAFTTPNTPPVAQDTSFGTVIWGSKNNTSANASSQVSLTWTGSITGGEADIVAASFR